MSSDDDPFKMILLIFGFFGVIILLNFLITPQTGEIGGYSITMPGISWIGLSAFAIMALILYVKKSLGLYLEITW
jgi:hypothetical protein